MFTCPNCNADRSRVLPIEPCPVCGQLLEGARPAGKFEPNATVVPTGEEDTIESHDSGLETVTSAVAPADGGVVTTSRTKVPSGGHQRPFDVLPRIPSQPPAMPPRKLVPGDDGPTVPLARGHGAASVAKSATRPPPIPSPIVNAKAPARVADQDDVFTKTVAHQAGPAAIGGPTIPRGDSPDFFTKTVADARASSDVVPPTQTRAPSPDFLTKTSASDGAVSHHLDAAPRPPQGVIGAPPIDYQQAVLAAGPPPDVDEMSYPEAALAALAHEGGVGGVSQSSEEPVAKAVWRDAHPSARKWVEKRGGAAARSPKPAVISLGLLVAGIGTYLLMIFLPGKAPLTAGEAARIAREVGAQESWRFSDSLFFIANVNAALFVVFGLVLVVRGALNRQGSVGTRKRRTTTITLAAAFALLLVCFVALLAAGSLKG